MRILYMQHNIYISVPHICVYTYAVCLLIMQSITPILAVLFMVSSVTLTQANADCANNWQCHEPGKFCSKSNTCLVSTGNNSCVSNYNCANASQCNIEGICRASVCFEEYCTHDGNCFKDEVCNHWPNGSRNCTKQCEVDNDCTQDCNRAMECVDSMCIAIFVPQQTPGMIARQSALTASALRDVSESLDGMKMVLGNLTRYLQEIMICSPPGPGWLQKADGDVDITTRHVERYTANVTINELLPWSPCVLQETELKSLVTVKFAGHKVSKESRSTARRLIDLEYSMNDTQLELQNSTFDNPPDVGFDTEDISLSNPDRPSFPEVGPIEVYELQPGEYEAQFEFNVAVIGIVDAQGKQLPIFNNQLFISAWNNSAVDRLHEVMDPHSALCATQPEICLAHTCVKETVECGPNMPCPMGQACDVANLRCVRANTAIVKDALQHTQAAVVDTGYVIDKILQVGSTHTLDKWRGVDTTASHDVITLQNPDAVVSSERFNDTFIRVQLSSPNVAYKPVHADAYFDISGTWSPEQRLQHLLSDVNFYLNPEDVLSITQQSLRYREFTFTSTYPEVDSGSTVFPAQNIVTFPPEWITVTYQMDSIEEVPYNWVGGKATWKPEKYETVWDCYDNVAEHTGWHTEYYSCASTSAYIRKLTNVGFASVTPIETTTNQHNWHEDGCLTRDQAQCVDWDRANDDRRCLEPYHRDTWSWSEYCPSRSLPSTAHVPQYTWTIDLTNWEFLWRDVLRISSSHFKRAWEALDKPSIVCTLHDPYLHESSRYTVQFNASQDIDALYYASLCGLSNLTITAARLTKFVWNPHIKYLDATPWFVLLGQAIQQQFALLDTTAAWLTQSLSALSDSGTVPLMQMGTVIQVWQDLLQTTFQYFEDAVEAHSPSFEGNDWMRTGRVSEIRLYNSTAHMESYVLELQNNATICAGLFDQHVLEPLRKQVEQFVSDTQNIECAETVDVNHFTWKVVGRLYVHNGKHSFWNSRPNCALCVPSVGDVVKLVEYELDELKQALLLCHDQAQLSANVMGDALTLRTHALEQHNHLGYKSAVFASIQTEFTVQAQYPMGTFTMDVPVFFWSLRFTVTDPAACCAAGCDSSVRYFTNQCVTPCNEFLRVDISNVQECSLYYTAPFVVDGISGSTDVVCPDPNDQGYNCRTYNQPAVPQRFVVSQFVLHRDDKLWWQILLETIAHNVLDMLVVVGEPPVYCDASGARRWGYKFNSDNVRLYKHSGFDLANSGVCGIAETYFAPLTIDTDSIVFHGSFDWRSHFAVAVEDVASSAESWLPYFRDAVQSICQSRLPVLNAAYFVAWYRDLLARAFSNDYAFLGYPSYVGTSATVDSILGNIEQVVTDVKNEELVALNSVVNPLKGAIWHALFAVHQQTPYSACVVHGVHDQYLQFALARFVFWDETETTQQIWPLVHTTCVYCIDSSKLLHVHSQLLERIFTDIQSCVNSTERTKEWSSNVLQPDELQRLIQENGNLRSDFIVSDEYWDLSYPYDITHVRHMYGCTPLHVHANNCTE